MAEGGRAALEAKVREQEAVIRELKARNARLESEVASLQSKREQEHLPPAIQAFTPLCDVPEIVACLAPLRPIHARLKTATTRAEVEAAIAVLEPAARTATAVIEREVHARLVDDNTVGQAYAASEAGSCYFEAVYTSVWRLIEKSETPFIASALEAASRLKGCVPRHLQVASQPSGPELAALYAAAAKVRGRFAAYVVGLADRVNARCKLKGATTNRVAVKVDFKELGRAIEKSVFKPDSATVFDVNRCLLVCDDMETVQTAVVALLEDAADEDRRQSDVQHHRPLEVVNSANNKARGGAAAPSPPRDDDDGRIVIRRVKDRYTTASAGGWRDLLVNLSFPAAADEDEDDEDVQARGGHVCEVQLSHATMLTARAGLPGHAIYARIRNANEQLAKLGMTSAKANANQTAVSWTFQSAEPTRKMRPLSSQQARPRLGSRQHLAHRPKSVLANRTAGNDDGQGRGLQANPRGGPFPPLAALRQRPANNNNNNNHPPRERPPDDLATWQVSTPGQALDEPGRGPPRGAAIKAARKLHKGRISRPGPFSGGSMRTLVADGSPPRNERLAAQHVGVDAIKVEGYPLSSPTTTQ